MRPNFTTEKDRTRGAVCFAGNHLAHEINGESLEDSDVAHKMGHPMGVVGLSDADFGSLDDNGLPFPATIGAQFRGQPSCIISPSILLLHTATQPILEAIAALSMAMS